MRKKSNHIWRYFGLLYIFSILLYLPILISGKGMYTVGNKILMVGIAFLPSFLGIVFVSASRDTAGLRTFWKRVFTWPKAQPSMIMLSLGITPIMTILAYGISKALAGEVPTLEYGMRMLSEVPLLVQFLVVEFFLGAVSEELGWRGYALDELIKRYSALKSSLIIGVIWAFWHTPAFFIPGLSQYEFGGILSLNYVGMMVAVIAGSILHTWSYVNTNRSILVSGILLHFAQNASLIFLGGIFDQHNIPPLFWIIQALLSWILASILIWFYGPSLKASKQTAPVEFQANMRSTTC